MSEMDILTERLALATNRIREISGEHFGQRELEELNKAFA